MASCHEMRTGETYMCAKCGIELQVVSDCGSGSNPESTCGDHEGGEQCEMSCCGEPLTKREKE